MQSVASQFANVTPLCPAITLSNPPEATSSHAGATSGPNLIRAALGSSIIGTTQVCIPPSGATPEPSLMGATPGPSLTGATPVFSPPSGATPGLSRLC